MKATPGEVGCSCSTSHHDCPRECGWQQGAVAQSGLERDECLRRRDLYEMNVAIAIHKSKGVRHMRARSGVFFAVLAALALMRCGNGLPDDAAIALIREAGGYPKSH